MSTVIKKSEQAATEIMEMITLQKRYKPGDKLPNEAELCKELNVSRTTLRAAIQSLASQNILIVQQGRGTFVADNDATKFGKEYGQLDFTSIRLRDLYETRLCLEPQAAYFAAQRGTDEEIQKILEYGKILENGLLQGEDVVESNRLFHNAISMATHNELLARLIPSLNSEIVKMFRKNNVKQVRNRFTLQDHKLIMAYLEARDANGVMEAMRLHLKHSMQDYDF